MTKHYAVSFICLLSALGSVPALQAQAPINAFIGTPANAGILSESCGGPYTLVIERVQGNTDTITIFISDFGTAQIGTDYTFPPGSFPLEMLPADTVKVLQVQVMDDGLNEGLESLGWELAYLAGIESGTINLESGIVDEYEVDIQSASDTITWCRYLPLQLTAVSNAEIHWSPTFLYDNPVGTEVTVRPFGSGWYYATVGTDTCGAKDSIYLDLAIVNIHEDDTVFICNDGTGIILPGQLQGLAGTFTWVPADSTLSDPNSLTPVANPTVTTTYILQSDIGVCIAADTILVRVDSLPEDQHIDIAPLKGYYCAGEIVALFSPSYDSLDFPDIQFSWSPNDDGTFLSDTTILNAALQLQDTTWYVRKNVNNACVTHDSILINVIPSSVPISVSDTILCPGEMFDVQILSNQVMEPEWTPADGLSCTECLDPKVTVIGAPGSTMLYQFSGKIKECPVGASLYIEVPGLQVIQIAGDQVACEGDMYPLTITNPEGLTDFHWAVESGDASLSCDNCPDPVITIQGTPPVRVIVTAATSDPNFCGAQGIFEISAGIVQQVAGPAVNACPGGETVATTGHPEFTNVVWDVFTGNLSIECTTCDPTTITVNSPGSLRFSAESPDPDVCRVFGTVAVSFSPDDVSTFTIVPDPNATPIGQGSNVMVMLNVSPSPATIMWTVNGVTIPATTNSIAFNAEEEINFIEATFINSHGCEQKDTISFPTVPPSYQIPNAFTPDNGDDVNDHFRIIINGNIRIEEFRIFNRWGQMVYDAPEGEGDMTGWDGLFQGERAPSDTYVYYATLRYPDDRLEVAKGDLLLLR